MAKDIFTFLGPPGSGKGTLSNLCVKELGFVQLSTGDLFRRHIKERTEIGKEIDFTIKSGKLVSDELVTSMVEEWISRKIDSLSRSIILDGYPRTAAQAKYFDEILSKKYSYLKFHVYRLAISDEQVINRLLSRCICQNNECQAVYSLIEGSCLSPKRKGFCDKCSSRLICRSDDLLDTIKKRLENYHIHENTLLNFYLSKNQDIKSIDAGKSIKEVFKEFKGLIK